MTRPRPKCQLTLRPDLHFPSDIQRGNLIINQHLDPLVIISLHFFNFSCTILPRVLKEVTKKGSFCGSVFLVSNCKKKQFGLPSLELHLGILLPYPLRFLGDPYTQGSLLVESHRGKHRSS